MVSVSGLRCTNFCNQDHLLDSKQPPATSHRILISSDLWLLLNKYVKKQTYRKEDGFTN